MEAGGLPPPRPEIPGWILVVFTVFSALAIWFLLLFFVLTQRSKKEEKQRKDEPARPLPASVRKNVQEVPEAPDAWDPRRLSEDVKPVVRPKETLEREDKLKREALHVFRRLKLSLDSKDEPEAVASLIDEALVLLDSTSGCSRADQVTADIVICNQLIHADGLGILHQLQENTDPKLRSAANKFIERVVPVIWS
jgi:hypothetical protein